MSAFLNWILQWLTQYGYLGLFALLVLGIVGLPIPNETLLVFSGYLISRGRFHPILTFVTAFLGSICGISFSYLIGRTLGRNVAVRFGKPFGITHKQLDRVHLWFQKTGEWFLAFGYFIPGVRHVTALVAGISHLNFMAFALFAWSGALVWVAAFLSLGYFVGENWQQAVGFIEKYTYLVVVLAGLIAFGYWWLRRKWLKP
jgi:membrane protein DedA with SNARE-associated domain